ncbi:polysaccharide biosynthesis tyrosine autokinase [Scytonema sp. UIC 10036]|uniref:GumC family protein n=1 Tax=Scytonema sp. UIC 10036 TaxID=2304196 RepID=UPI0012DA7701|nr:polysaccharide biosynthesis tyrosine autokinase [Scytonema sp. UIC 10036]MUG97002.1 polysaccharide biosynthesis tyrosine autokinase [Scytonema sp. UIC 10036]
METKGYQQEEIDIQKYLLVLKRRWHIIAGVSLVSVCLAGMAATLQKPKYQATGILLIQSDRTSSLTKAGEKIGHLESLMREGNPSDTQAVVVSSAPILQQVIDKLGLKNGDGTPLDTEGLDIKVEPVVGTDVLKVSYTAKAPKLAADVVNHVMSAYVDNNIKSNQSQVLAAGEFIKKQLPYARTELERASEALRQFKTSNKIVELKQEASSAISNVAQLDDTINQAQAELAEVSAQQAKVLNQLKLAGQDAVEITSLNQIPGVQDVLTELQKVQTKLANERARYTEKHPSVVNLQEQEVTLSTLLQRRIGETAGSQQKVSTSKLQLGKIKQDMTVEYASLEKKRQGLEEKIKSLSDIRNGYKQRLTVMPNLEKRHGDLERRLELAQKNYENLTLRLQEIHVAEKQTVGNARIIQPAQLPKKPALSKLTLLLPVAGVFGGLLVGVAAAFFIDLIDRSLKTAKEAEAFFDYTLLGLIPSFESSITSASDRLMREGISPRVIVATSPRTVIHEAYQMLQANLKFISHKRLRTIVVTSSVPGEGKSEVSANLAAVLAQSERRVLLIDADMRQPSQHHLWGLINSAGLSNVIVAQDEFSHAVQEVTTHLSVLTAGVQPPNPLALIDSERMTSLIQTFSETYDYIIIDTPPLVGTADAAVLGKMADGVLLVVRPGVVDSRSAMAAKSLIERSEANILGIVANAVKVKHEPNSYFYYSNPRTGQSVTETEVGTERWVYK